MEQLGVKIVYRNKQQEPIYEKDYSLKEYTDMLRQEQLRLITDVEDLCYAANENNTKDEWDDDTWAAFCKIKHKLLDKAGEISRLPDVLIKIQE